MDTFAQTVFTIIGFWTESFFVGIGACIRRKAGEARMDKLLDIALWILIPIVVLLAVCGTSVVVCLCLNLFFGINVFGLT